MLHINFRKAILPLLLVSGSYVAHATKIEGDRVTAMDQAQGSKMDVEMTRKIRVKLIADKSLSSQAQNVTVVTLGKNVTLRGSVESQRERIAVKVHIRQVVADAMINEKYLKIIPAPAPAR
ncbi:MAG: hypothetical protein ABIR96_12865 [Bdellovibrionota bacterium]